MSFNATPLGQGRRLDHSTFLGKHQQHRQRETDPLPPPPRLFQHSSTSHLHPPPPSSDDDNQPALVRYARLKQREQATAISLTSRPGAPGIINTPPNPERWSVKDTSVNVATAFHQAAASAIPDIIDMQTVPDTTANGSWASSTSTRPPRSTSVEYEKETQSISLRNRLAPPPSRINTAAGAGLRSNPNNTTPTSRRPLTKSTTSATLVPDSEAENELDVNGRAKSPFNQVVDAAKRALAPATFYLRQRSQEPEGAADRSTASNNANGQHSSYDYSAEEREFQANISRKPTTTTTTSTHRKNRMSIDKKAYQPSPSDDEGSEEWSDDGKGRRRMRKKKKHEPLGGPLTTLPVMSADKRKRRKSKGKTGEEDGGSESEENVTERASNSRSSIPRQSVPPEPISNNVGEVSLDDAEQGLHSIPEVEVEEDQVEEEEEEAHDSERLHSPHAAPTHSVSFSIGAILGRLVNVTLRTCINFLVLLVNLLSAVFFVFGRIIGTIAEILFLRPLKILGLSSSSTDPPKPIGKYLLIGFAICAIWYAIQEPNKSIPISLPSVFTSKTKKHDPVYVAPADVPTDFSQLVTRLQAMEYAFSQLADDRATSQDLRDRLDELAESVSREARERKRVMDTVDGKVRDVVRDGVQTAVRRVEEVEKKMAQDVERVDRDRRVGESLVTRVKEVEHQVASVVGGEMASLKREIEALRAKLAASATVAPSKKEAASDEEARNRLRVLEDRLVEMEGDVKEAIELGKKAALAVPTTETSTPWWTKFSPSKGSSGLSEGITIKSTDGQDITALLDQLVTSSVLTHVYKDGLAKTDYARFSAGARVIPSLTSPTIEQYPTSWTTQVVSFFTGHGTAVGRPPVVALHHEVYEGFCWPFKGSEGQLGVLLSAPVKVESVTVDHVPTEVARDVRSAPKEMEVWGLIDGEENRTKVKEWKEKKKLEREAAGQEGDDVDVVPYPPSLPREPEYIRLANFTYDIDGPSHIQNFPVDEEIREMDLDFGIVVLMIQNNWGRNDFTCLYRFRVHGTKLEEEVPVPISLEGPESVEEMLM
ncbi:hypothetical protein JOM56_013855 [Amanita muscaria]